MHQTANIVADLYTDLDQRPVFHKRSTLEVRELIREPLPREPGDPTALIEQVRRDIFGTATLNISPNFYAYIISGGNQMGIVGEFLSAALNQNCIKWHLAASAAELGQQVLRWIAEFIGLPDHGHGVLVSGGSMANLTGLAMARKARAPFDASRIGNNFERPLVAYTSADAHFCHLKGADAIGLGKDHMRVMEVDADHRIDANDLERRIKADLAEGFTPYCVMASAGTANTGSVDPIDAIADICERYGLWLHVDAVYGGPAGAIESERAKFKGWERADSIALDPHKWLYVPIETACLMVRDPEPLEDLCSVYRNLGAEFLKYDLGDDPRADYMNHTPQLTRSFRALKVWMTFKGYGADRIREANADDIANLETLLAVLAPCEPGLRFGLMVHLVDVAWADGGIAAGEYAALNLAKRRLAITEAQLRAIGDLVRAQRGVKPDGTPLDDGLTFDQRLTPILDALQAAEVPLSAMYFSGQALEFQAPEVTE